MVLPLGGVYSASEAGTSKLIDDDIKCAVVTRHLPRELRKLLMLQAALVADRFSKMHDIVSWMMAKKKTFGPSSPEAQKHEALTPMEINAMGNGFGKCKGPGKDGGKGKCGKDGGKRNKGMAVFPGYCCG